MAAPITHIVLTNKIFPKFFNDMEKSSFIVGTSFSDIRYLGIIDRDQTHKNGLTLSKIKEEDSSFEAGLKFHSLLDEVRINFVSKYESSSDFPKSKFSITALKFLEDEVLYNKIKDWKEIAQFFNKIYDGELKRVKKKDVSKWHQYLIKYFKKKPNKQTRKEIILNIGFSEKDGEEIEKIITRLRKTKTLSLIESFYNQFDELLEKR